MMEYKGYIGDVTFDNDAGVFHGEVLGIRDVITFEASCVDELRQAFRDSVDDYLDFCAQRGESPEKPFSGRFQLRIDPALHRKISISASGAKLSMNKWVMEVLEKAVASR